MYSLIERIIISAQPHVIINNCTDDELRGLVEHFDETDDVYETIMDEIDCRRNNWGKSYYLCGNVQ